MGGPGQRPYLTTNDKLLGLRSDGRTRSQACTDYRRGYLTGMVRGDANLKVYRYQRAGRANGDVHRFRLALADVEGLHRTHDYLAQEGISTDWFDFTPATERPPGHDRDPDVQARPRSRGSWSSIAWPADATDAWQRGFLAGIFDAEGSRSSGILRISNTDDEILAHTHGALTDVRLRRGARGPRSGQRPHLPPRARRPARAHALRPPRRSGDPAEVFGRGHRGEERRRSAGGRASSRSASRCRCTTSRPAPATSSRTASSATTASPGDARMARTGRRSRLRQPDRGQDEPRRRAAAGAGPAVAGSASTSRWARTPTRTSGPRAATS